MASTIDITADTGDAIIEIDRFTNALNAYNDRITQVKQSIAQFNEKGQLIGASVKSQVGAFGELTQQISYANGQIQVLSSAYKDNAAAAEAAAKRQQAADAETFRKGREYREKKIQADRDAASAKKKLDDDEAARIERHGTVFSNVLNRIGRNLVQFASYRAFSNTVEGLQEGVQAAKDFQIQISLIRTISQDKQLAFTDFAKGIREVSDKSGVDIKDVGKAFYDTTSNQIAKGADVAPFVQQATDLARVTGSELPDAVNILSSRINAYGLSVTDAAKLSAEFFRVVDEGRVVLKDYANTLGRVDVLASNLGVAYQDVDAILAITTQKGFKSADAITLLTNLLIQFEKPSEKLSAFFKNVLGVESGEAAIKLKGGLIPLVQTLLQATRSGQLSTSDIAPDIRGRKQFAVFESSIPQIEEFSNKLKDTAASAKIFQDAIGIRGESAADALVKQLNQLSNVFKVDFGQGILKAAANTLEFFGGMESIVNVSDRTTDTLKVATGVVTAYGVTAGIAAVANYGLAASFTAAGTAALRLLPVAAAVAGIYAGFKIGKFVQGGGESDFFGKVDPDKITGTVERLAEAQKKYQAIRDQRKGVAANPFEQFDNQNKVVGDSFQTVIDFMAKANIANNKLLEDSKSKSQEAAGAIKVAFSGFIDSSRNSISFFKKDIQDANSELEKSKKSILGFKDSIDALLFATKSKYANEDFGGDFGQIGGQKAKLLQQQQADLEARAEIAARSKTPEGAEEARKLLLDAAKVAQQLFELQTDVGKKQAEQAGATGIYYVDTIKLQNELNRLKQKNLDIEKVITDNVKLRKAGDEEGVKILTEKERILEQALKKYEAIDVFDKGGAIKPQYRDVGGQFDRSKLDAELNTGEKAIIDAVGSNAEQRIALTKLFLDRRVALNKEANAQETKDFLKNSEAQVLAEQDRLNKANATAKERLKTNLQEQANAVNSLRQKPEELKGFSNALIEGGGVTDAEKAQLLGLPVAFNEAVKKLQDNPIIKDGVKLFDPKLAAEAVTAYDSAVQKILEIQKNVSGRTKLKDDVLNPLGIFGDTPTRGITNLDTIDAQGKPVSPQGSAKDVKDLVETLRTAGGNAFGTLQELQLNAQQFDSNVKIPIEALKQKFPDLAKSADDATKAMSKSFQDFSTGGVQPLIDQLDKLNQRIQEGLKGLQKLPIGNANNVGANDGGEVYAATGGVVGMFPGQPRGADVYPIWAAKGETIVSAQTSAMYKPMLEAIMARRMPRYMAGGGTVGDTNIGDINVTVNGAKTNSDTGRAIATKLERELRRRNISFKQR